MTFVTLPPAAQTAPWLKDQVAQELRSAREAITALQQLQTTQAQLVAQAWNRIQVHLANVAAFGETLSELHSDPATREVAEKALIQADELRTAVQQDQAVYTALAAADLDTAAAAPKRLLELALRDFRRAGVDRDQPTRARLAELSRQLSTTGVEFSRNIREDVRSIRVRPEQLAGMPADWVQAHPPGPDGLVTVTTDSPDLSPFLSYAEDETARQELLRADWQRGWPANEAVLQRLLTLRQEFADLLGYENWAQYDAEVKMIGDATLIRPFLEGIKEAAAATAARDFAALVARRAQDIPGAQTLDRSAAAYYRHKYQLEHFDVDSQEVRQFFPFPAVRDGLLAVTGRLLGLTYTPATEARPWHEDVSAYDVHERDSGELLGRIYLDLHPREGKYKHAACFDLRPGVAGEQLPEGVLGTNVSKELLEHDDVVMLFHEFGHLVHHLLGGQGPYAGLGSFAVEWDFVEAPSQLLEEWAWDPRVLATFAHNHAGEAIPAELVQRMRRADEFGKGLDARTQTFYAALSYTLHTDPDSHANLDATTEQLHREFSLYEPIPHTHFAMSFGHLDSYSSAYYTYMWSLVIAKDLFSAFDSDDLFATAPAARYRAEVLAPGAQADAATLVRNFLGRDYTNTAFQEWLAT